MAFKILASATPEDNTLVSVERVDLGDPRKVKFHPTSEGGVKYEDYFRFARQLFSTENIRANPGIFSQPRLGPSGQWIEAGTDFSRKFLEKVPEHLHEFGFAMSVYYDPYDDREIDNRITISYDSYSCVLHGQNCGGQTVSINSDAYWAGIILFLSSVKDFFNGAVWRVVKGACSTHQTPAPTNAFKYAGLLMNGCRYIIRAPTLHSLHTGTPITSESAMELLNNEGAEVSLEFVQVNNQYVLLAPVSLLNKSSLYQLFSSTQDITAILGKGSPIKKTIVKNSKSVVVEALSQKLYGVELELSTDKTVRQIIDAQGDPVRFLCKQDGSITGSKRNRYECVTVPLAMSEHRQLWTRFFTNIGSKGDFDISTQTNNGMHVHIGRKLFTEGHLRNFTWFITAPENREFMLQISQRSQESFDRWSPCPKYNNYRSHLDSYKACVQAVSSLRGAVNIGNTRNKPTVEVRIFKGIVSCAEVLRNLEVVDSIFEFTKPINEGGYSNYQTLTIENYYNWVKSTPKTQYKNLRADLWKLDIPLLVRKARALRLLFNMTDPEQIAKIVNREKVRTEAYKDESKRFVVDKIVFATVTRLVGRRAFDLSEEGVLTVVHKAVGRIAHLDEKLITSYDKRVKAGR